MSRNSDQQLIEQVLGGQTNAFGELIDRYMRPLFNVALRMLNSRDDAEDVVQAVFLKAFERLETYDPRFKFFSWIYRMTVNESINTLKQQNRFEVLDWSLESVDNRPDEEFRERETSDRVGLALMVLSPEDRAIVLLRHFQEFSYDEIGFILNIPSKTVKSRLYTARQRLKQILIHRGFGETYA